MKILPVSELNLEPTRRIAKEWMLLTAGDQLTGYNTMTCSWGHIGSIWGTGGGMATSVCYVRPQRYTWEFMERSEVYTLCFFPEDQKKKLAYLGTHSGRDGDKVKEAGLTPVFADGYTYFAEASLVLVCRKLYCAPMKEEYFVDKTIVQQHYPDKDFHTMYIGEILKVYTADNSCHVEIE